MVLETVYEQDFLPCSFGFRPGRSAHQALQYLRTGFMSQGLRWVIDIDIEKYFDSIPHSQLRDFLDQRVTDGVIRRMIDKWLKAGVLEDDLLRHTAEGSPQGGVISPCLSNIFLHHVLDEWFEHDVRPRLKGRCTLVRFADDAVMAFEHVLDAQRVLGVLGKRLARYGLTLHPDKTRFVDFRNTESTGTTHPEADGTTFTFLGFTHIWGKSRAGNNVVRQVTAKNRGGDGLVSDQPASVHLGPARPSDRNDAGPLCLLRHNRQLSTIKLVRPSAREDLGEMAVTAGSRKPVLLAPVHCAPKALSSPSTSNCPSLHHCERGSPMKNRKREICTSGSVRDEDGQPPHLLGRRNFLHLAAGAAALPAASRVALAQAYPSRPVRIIVGFAAGGPSDIVARLIAQWLSERLGQPFVIENRPGGGGNIGTEAAVRAAPDGYTLLLVGVPNAINATLYDKLNFHFIRDIAPVAGIERHPYVMVVNPSFPPKAVSEFIAYAKANP